MLIVSRLIFTAVFFCFSLLAKGQDVRFSKVSADEGLSSNTVNCIFQDFRGFLWVGTPDGLNRYDGYGFQVFRSGGDSLSLSDNAVWAIAETKDSSLWVGTSAGLNRYNRKKKLFQHINIADKNDVLHNSVMSLLKDREGNLWVGTLRGLVKIQNINKQSFTVHQFDKEKHDLIKNASVLSIEEDTKGNMWFAADSSGLLKMDKDGNIQRLGQDAGINAGKIMSVSYDAANGILWAGSDIGLYRIDDNGKVKLYQNDEKKSNSLRENFIQKVFTDRLGRLWVGTSTQGLCLFRPKTETFGNFRRDINNPNSLSDNSYLRAIYEDKTGIIWFGTQDGGLNKYDPNKTKFHTILPSKYFMSVNPNTSISVINEDHNGHLWLGATDAGIVRIAPTYTKSFTTKDGLMSNRITGIVNDKYGSLWFSTKDRGVGKMTYNGGKMSVVTYQNKFGDDGLPSNQIQKLFRDREGEVWAITANGSICRYNRGMNDFEVILEGGARGSNIPTPVYITKTGLMWIGTPKGFFLFDPREKLILKDYRGKSSKNINTVYSLYQASDTILWVGSIRGLSKFYLKKDSVMHFASKQGLTGDVVFNILEDSLGTLWVTTNKGLSRFSPKSGNFRNYDASNGLINGEFQQNAAVKSASGRLYFGGTGGFTHFFPSEIKDNPHKPSVVFMDLEVFSQPLPINVPIVFERPARDEETSELKEFTLFYEDFNFDIQFAALHFSDPKKNQYEYMLEGYETKWNKRDWTRRFISYNNLPYGEYFLRVRASNSDGIWNDEGVKLKISVQPPIWDKWSFKIGLVVFIMLSIYVFNTIRLRRIKKQNERLERIVEERTEEIREKTNQILDSIRYAETIQAAILPTEEEFKTYLPNGFKIYLPRDIVSGDFYWLKHTKGMTYVAVVDCTGHGVPGAFMSMIGASLLNDTVNQAAGAQTAFVLSTLHEKIRIALRQEDERNTDGMDIALCAIDEKNSKLLYTGAKRSLYIVRNKEVLELKGDRKSVGGRSKKDKDEKEFTTKEFPLLRGDMVYLTTDGFVDQPDESGKKYGSLNLFKDLVDISSMGINEQRKFLSEKLRKHSGNAKQRDDITLIGFRF